MSSSAMQRERFIFLLTPRSASQKVVEVELHRMFSSCKAQQTAGCQVTWVIYYWHSGPA